LTYGGGGHLTGGGLENFIKIVNLNQSFIPEIKYLRCWTGWWWWA